MKDAEQSSRHSGSSSSSSSNRHDEAVTAPTYTVVPDPVSEQIDLSDLRGVTQPDGHTAAAATTTNNNNNNSMVAPSDTDLENLAELVPDVKARRRASDEQRGNDKNDSDNENDENIEMMVDEEDPISPNSHHNMSVKSEISTAARRMSVEPTAATKTTATATMPLNHVDSLQVQHSFEKDGAKKKSAYPSKNNHNKNHDDSNHNDTTENSNNNPYADETSYDGYPNSEDDEEDDKAHKIPNEFMNMTSSGQSISTATQTHEVRMPMYLPTFKPATGCTNASDFTVRCFVARLRSGITVVKHGRSRWCKSRLRILHIHSDGRSLSWKPAEGEPTSSKRPPKLDLSTCLEVRHAWSPDPSNPMYTGTPILRQKCEAANAHKSFALIFKLRTVDITAVTADQCKVLMEGFSALCFRLQVATLAANNGNGNGRKAQHGRPMPEEDGVSTTASVTLTNSSAPPRR